MDLALVTGGSDGFEKECKKGSGDSQHRQLFTEFTFSILPEGLFIFESLKVVRRLRKEYL